MNKSLKWVLVPIAVIVVFVSTADAARWSFHFSYTSAPGGQLRVYATINCQKVQPPIFEGYAVMCSTYSGWVPPAPVNDLMFEFDWDYWCGNKDRFKVAVPVYDGSQWVLQPLAPWIDASVPRTLPALGDPNGITPEIYVMVNLPAWTNLPLQSLYTVTNGESPQLPGYLIGTTPFVFDPTAPAGDWRNAFSTTRYSGTLWRDGELTHAPQLQANVPPIIAEVAPDPDTVTAGEEYVEQLVLLQGSSPITWTLVGPPGAYVDASGRVAGWTPGSADVGLIHPFEVRAENAFGGYVEIWQVQVLEGFTPYPEYTIASTAADWVQKLESGPGAMPAVTPVEYMSPDVEEELMIMGEPLENWRPARLYATGQLEGRDALIMAFGDTPVTEGQGVVAAFDYAIGRDCPQCPNGYYGFYSETHDPVGAGMEASKPGPEPEPTWCNWPDWRRIRFWNYWWFYPWQGKKWIVFYDVNGRRLMMDYQKWWPRWPWFYRYWWPYRIYPWYAASWYYYPYWGWQWWYWWRPWTSWYVDPGFQPWRVVRVRYWERSYWFGRPPPPWWGGPWPWPWLPAPGDGKDGQQLLQTPPDVPWNAWGDMAVDRAEKQPPRICDPMNPVIVDVEGGGGGGAVGTGDGDVDLSDFAVFQGCFNGPNRPYAGSPERQSLCACFDRDDDDDVDLTDFSVFQTCFNGPNRPTAPGCPAVAY